jgi:hypothetical protein
VSFFTNLKGLEVGMSALRADGTIWRVLRDNVPVQVTGIDDVTFYANGLFDELFAVKRDGTLWYGGRAQWKQLANIDSVHAVATIHPGGVPVALKTDGTVWYSFGQDHQSGQNLWREIPGLAGTVSLTPVPAGPVGPLVVKADGTAWRIEDPRDGPIRAAPIYPEVGEIAAVAIGSDGVSNIRLWADIYTLILRRDGTVWSAGSNRHGTLGLRQTPDTCDGGTPCAKTLVQIPNLQNVKAIAAGGKFALAVVGGS